MNNHAFTSIGYNENIHPNIMIQKVQNEDEELKPRAYPFEDQSLNLQSNLVRSVVPPTYVY